MQLVKSGLMGREYGKKDMVFCLIYADDSTPYDNYDYFLKSKEERLQEKANMVVPTVLAQMRWDGCIGFPGGNVEQRHNTLIEALKDELSEEIGLHDIDMSKLEVFKTFADNERHIISFTYKVSYKEFLDIYNNSLKARHFRAENVGSLMMEIHGVSVYNLMKQTFSGAGKEELRYLIEEKNLIKDKDFLKNKIIKREETIFFYI